MNYLFCCLWQLVSYATPKGLNEYKLSHSNPKCLYVTHTRRIKPILLIVVLLIAANDLSLLLCLMSHSQIPEEYCNN